MQATQIKGLLLEEVVAYLLRDAGYRPIRSRKRDPKWLQEGPNGLRVLGRGGEHQVDVLAELFPTPPYSPPMRIISEAKWQDKPIGIEVVRAGIGIIEDTNQGARTSIALRKSPAFRLPVNYLYRYILFSKSGFSRDAQLMALAHHVTLVDFGSTEFSDLRAAISKTGDELFRKLRDYERRHGKIDGVMAAIRRPVAEGLNPHEDLGWREDQTTPLPATLLDAIMPSVRILKLAADLFDELFLAVTQTGWLILAAVKAKPDRRRAEAAKVRAIVDEGETRKVRLWWKRQGEKRIRWQLDIKREDNTGVDVRLEFALPDNVVRQLVASESIKREAIHLKGEHFSSIQLYRTQGGRLRSATLEMDRRWLEDAENAVENAEQWRRREEDVED